MIYLTFREGRRPDDARVVAATSDPAVVRAALGALLGRLGADLASAAPESPPTNGAGSAHVPPCSCGGARAGNG